MKNFLKKSVQYILFFSVFFILINLLYMWIIIKTDFDFRKRLESLNFNDPAFELLVIGASTSLDGFDTGWLTENGIPSYNLAIGGTTVKTNFLQLSEYLEKYSIKPKYVLLGLNSGLVKSFDDENMNPIIEVTLKDHEFGINDAPILKFKWLGFEFLKKILSESHRKAKISYGQIKYHKAITDNSEFGKSYLDVSEFESSFWIGEVAKLCSSYGIKLIVLEMPGYNSTRNLSDTGPYTLKFRNGSSATLYNFNSHEFCKIFHADKDWIGNSHLNEYGAIKLTREVKKIL